MARKERAKGPGFEESLDRFLERELPAPVPMPDEVQGPRTLRSRAKSAWETVLRSKAVWIAFAAAFFALTWRLGSYPAYFNDIVEHMIHVQVDRIFDHMDVSNLVTWYWSAMYTHQAYTSPVFSLFVEAGLRLFGLTLFGVRIFPALLDFGALLLAYFGLKRFLPRNLVLTFVLLLALSPWNLLYARSGGIFALSLGMYLVSVSMLLLMTGRKRSIPFAILAGLSVALLPYGYVALRIPFLLLAFVVFYASERFERTNYLVFFSTLALVVSVQLGNLEDSLDQFFNARGEGLNTFAKLADGTYDFGLLLVKLRDNATVLLRQLLGGNVPGEYFDLNIADNFYRGDVVLYPKFLVPFLVLGLVFCLYHLFFKRKALPGLIVLFFAAGLVPGMMSGIGQPNLSRGMLLLVPVYLLIAYGMYHAFRVVHSWISPRKPRWVPALLVVALLATSVYQMTNFFDNEKDGKTSFVVQRRVYEDVIREYARRNPDKTILFHDVSPFYVYSYVVMEWVGEDAVRTLLDEGRLTFVRQENQEQVHKRLVAGQFDLIVTMDSDTLERIYPEVTGMDRDIQAGFTLYTADEETRLQMFLTK